MANDSEFVSHLLDLMSAVGPVNARRMFGGHGIFLHGLMFALVADDQLYLKVDEENRAEFEALELPPFWYDKAGKRVAMSYFLAPEAALESAEEMHKWSLSGLGAARRSRKN